MEPYRRAELAQALFEEAGDALFLFDPDTDRLLDVNPMALKLTGFPRPELLRLEATYLFRFGGKGGKQRLRDASQKTGVFHAQDGYFLRTGQDGVWVPVNLTVTRLHVQPKTLALITARDVRERQEAHTRLEQMEAELRRVLASVPDCLWSADGGDDDSLTYRYFSPVVETITGRPPDYFLGGPEHWEGVIHPDDRPRWRQSLGRLQCGLPGREEYRVVRTDGAVRWVHDSVLVSRGPDGRALRLDGIVTDITERKQAQEALREGENRLQAIMDNCTAVIYLKDLEGRYLLTNRQHELLFHLTREQLKGKTDYDIFPRANADAFRANDRRVLEAGAAVEMEEVAPHDDGPHTYISIKFPLRDAAGATYAVCGISTDITERKRAEEALKRTTKELTRSNQELQRLAADLERTAASERQAHRELKQAQSRMVQSEKLMALGQMVAGVAHEINNPLAFVITNNAVLQRDLTAVSELLGLYREADGILAQHGPEVFERIRAHGERIDLPYTLNSLDSLIARSRDGLKRIQQIVKDLRDFARLDDSDLQEVHLNAGIESTVNIIRGRAVKKNVRLKLELGTLPPVTCYPAKINQVVLNLVANAIDACDEGGEVTIRTGAVDAGVEVHVLDNGHGIDPAIRDKIFDPFFTTKPPGKGTGLGLSISHGIIEDHAGRIDVESAPGEGAHFTVHLPLSAPRVGFGRRQ